jgi:hypothetical protein
MTRSLLFGKIEYQVTILGASDMSRLMLVYVLCVAMVACESSNDKDESVGTTPTEEVEVESLRADALVISGSLANGVDQDNTDILEDQSVNVVRNDGAVIATVDSKDAGAFTISLGPGALVIDSAYGLLADGTNEATTEDFSFQLEAKVSNDGDGRALGIRLPLDLGESNTTSGKLDLGKNELKEISAIVGTVSFVDTSITPTNTDVFIPGKAFFVRTGDDGAFALTFVPAGTYDIRVVKGSYIKTVSVTVVAGKTTDLGNIEVSLTERDPLPLDKALIGTWSTKCYYASTMATTPENPRTGTIVISSLTSVTITGDSCFVRNFGATLKPFAAFIVGSDGSLFTKFDDGSVGYSTHTVITYTNDRITLEVENTGIDSSRVIEVLTRVK